MQDLLQQEGVFQTLIQEYGSAATANTTSVEGESEELPSDKKAESEKKASDQEEEKRKGGKLMLDEERETGEVAWSTYGHYLRALGPWWWSVVILFTLCMVEGSRALNTLFLGFWAGRHCDNFSTGQYMAVYAGEPQTNGDTDVHLG